MVAFGSRSHLSAFSFRGLLSIRNRFRYVSPQPILGANRGRGPSLPLALLLVAATLGSGKAQAQLTAHVGTTTNVIYQGGPGEGLALDAAGNLFIGFDENLGVYEASYSNGTYAPAAYVGGPTDIIYGIAVDTAGNIYSADEATGAIYQAVPGNGTYTFTAIISGLGESAGVGVDGFGNIYTNNLRNTLYKYTLSNGTYTQHILASNFTLTRNLAVDASGVIYQTDENGGANRSGVVRIFIPSGSVETTTTYTEATPIQCIDFCAGVAVHNGIVYVGDGFNLYKEMPDGSGGYTQTTISNSYGAIRGMAVDADGNVFVSDLNSGNFSKTTTALPDFGQVAVGATSVSQGVRFVIDSNSESTAFGTPNVLTLGATSQDFSLATNGCIGTPLAGSTCTIQITLAPQAPGERYGAVELTDAGGNVIATGYIQGNGTAPLATLTPGVISTAAGNGTAGVTLNNNQDVTIDGFGNLYIADAGNSRILKVSGGTATAYGSGFSGTLSSVAMDGAGNLYVAELANDDVKVVNSATGLASIVAGASGLNGPASIAVDGSGSLYVAEQAGNQIVKIASGTITVMAGTGTAGYNGDNIQATTAEVSAPSGIGLDSSGNVYVADSGNSRIREINAANGLITTVAGFASTGYSGDGGLAISATLNNPLGHIAVDPGGDVYFADSGNHVVREVTLASGVIATIGGTGTAGYSGDGGAATAAALSTPDSLVMDGAGNLYIDDNGVTPVMRKVTAGGATLNFGNVIADTTGTQNSVLNNIGNEPLSFTVPSAGTNPSLSAGFTLGNASTCPQLLTSSAAAVLAPGASCVDAIEVNSSALGTLSGSLISTDTSLNASPGTTQSVQLSANVTPPAPTVTFAVPNHTYGDAPFNIAATSNSTGAFTYTVVSGPATIIGSRVTLLGPGTVVVQAAEAADNNYLAATREASFSVATGVTTINFAIPNHTFGDAPFNIAATSNSTGAFNYTVVSGPATITGSTVTLLGPGTVVVQAAEAADSNYLAATKETSFTVASGLTTITFTVPNHTFGDPAFVVSATSTSTGAFTYSVVSGPATVSGATVTMTGLGTVVLQAAEAADANHPAAVSRATFKVSPAGLVVAAGNAARLYGAANPAFTGTVTGAKDGETFTETFSTAATQLASVGKYTIVPTAIGANLSDYTVTTVNGTFIVNQAPTLTTISASSATVSANQSVHVTVNVVSSTTGTPTGSVSVFDNGVALQTVALTSGAATFTTALSPSATHLLTASYAGDENFLASLNTGGGFTVAESVLSFTFNGNGEEALTVAPGKAASYHFSLAPSFGSYAGTVSFAVTGLPEGATASFTPSSVSAGGGAQTVTMTVQTASSLASSTAPSSGRQLHMPMMALLLLPLFGSRKLRRRLGSRLLTLLLLAAGLSGAAAGMTGCGNSGNGFLDQKPQTYQLTVTASSGALRHSSIVTLNVQ